MAPRAAGVELDADYHDRWIKLATWAVNSDHGAAARFAIMFALSLRWPSFADGSHVTRVRARVWQVVMPCGASTQRVALFEDDLVIALLSTVQKTKSFPAPVFPKVPCGSYESEVWAHSCASRKYHRGEKNFAALCRRFNIAATDRPLDIYAVSVRCFYAMFTWSVEDEDELMAKQFGTKSSYRAHYSLRRFASAACEHLGDLRSEGGDTFFAPTSDAK